MAELKREMGPYLKKWKERVLDYASPLELMEGNLLYASLYHVFAIKFPPA